MGPRFWAVDGYFFPAKKPAFKRYVYPFCFGWLHAAKQQPHRVASTNRNTVDIRAVQEQSVTSLPLLFFTQGIGALCGGFPLGLWIRIGPSTLNSPAHMLHLPQRDHLPNECCTYLKSILHMLMSLSLSLSLSLYIYIYILLCCMFFPKCEALSVASFRQARTAECR